MVAFRAMTDLDWLWIKARAKPIRCEDTQGIMAYEGESGKVLAGCALDSFTVTSCLSHMAIDNPNVLRHGFLQALAWHIFVTCGRTNVMGIVPSTNDRALKFNRHIGFREVSRIPDGYDVGIDYVVMQMTRDECKWLEVSNGAECRQVA